MLSSDQAGFTLIELLIVIVIITALAVTVFVTLNPTKRLADARDSRRRSDVESILTAIHEYIIDNGNFPPSIASRSALGGDWQLGNSACTGSLNRGGCTATVSGAGCGPSCCADFTSELAKYLKSIPVDPLGGQNNAGNTGYVVSWTNSAPSIITVKACWAEGGSNILQSR